VFNPRLQLPTDTSWLRPSAPESDPGGVFDRVLGTDPAGPGGPFGLVSALSPRAGRVPRPVWDTAHEAHEYWQDRPEVRAVRTVLLRALRDPDFPCHSVATGTDLSRHLNAAQARRLFDGPVRIRQMIRCVLETERHARFPQLGAVRVNDGELVIAATRTPAASNDGYRLRLSEVLDMGRLAVKLGAAMFPASEHNNRAPSWPVLTADRVRDLVVDLDAGVEAAFWREDPWLPGSEQQHLHRLLPLTESLAAPALARLIVSGSPWARFEERTETLYDTRLTPAQAVTGYVDRLEALVPVLAGARSWHEVGPLLERDLDARFLDARFWDDDPDPTSFTDQVHVLVGHLARLAPRPEAKTVLAEAQRLTAAASQADAAPGFDPPRHRGPAGRRTDQHRHR
jgi:hypothetical protein